MYAAFKFWLLHTWICTIFLLIIAPGAMDPFLRRAIIKDINAKIEHTHFKKIKLILHENNQLMLSNFMRSVSLIKLHILF